MIKQALSEAGLTPIAVVGLLLFVGIFLAVVVWLATRRRSDVDAWASLPLADGHDPVQPRERSVDATRSSAADRRGEEAAPGDAHTHLSQALPEAGHGHGGCGKCATCTCVAANETVTTLSIV